LAFAAALAAEDWPRFRGPNGAGVSDTARALPTEFGPSKNLLWKTPLPPGHSSPVLSGKRVFLTAFEGTKLLTICLDQDTGKVLWRRESPRSRTETLDNRNSPASPTPAADGASVFVFFPDYGLLSYDYEGNERWRAPLGPFRNSYGMGASPIVVDGRVVLVCDQTLGSYAAAFSAEDGRPLWRTPRPEALSGHSTPVVHRAANGPAEIVAPGSFRMDAYSAATGEIVWSARGLTSEMKSVPVLADGVVYINGYNMAENDPGRQVALPEFEDVLAKHDRDRSGTISLAESPDERTRKYFPYLDLNHDGSLDAAEWGLYKLSMAAENGLLAIQAGGKVLWKYHKAIPQLPSTLLYRGVLYMISDSGVLTTLDPTTGAVLKQARLRGAADNFYASPVAGDGKVYFVSLSGVVTVLRPGGEQEPLAVNELDEEVFATPAIGDGRIYIRTRGALWCFGRAAM
jgi:outer membrane protein assembly factor BamB